MTAKTSSHSHRRERFNRHGCEAGGRLRANRVEPFPTVPNHSENGSIEPFPPFPVVRRERERLDWYRANSDGERRASLAVKKAKPAGNRRLAERK